MSLKIAVLNLMPKKIETEKQLKKKIVGLNKSINFTFIKTATYTPKNTDIDYLNKFYFEFDEIKNKDFDGFICTGAPLEKIPFESVIYWDELTKILNWCKKNIFSSFFICWGAQAALYHYYKIEKHLMKEKISGIYSQKKMLKNEELTKQFSSEILVPVSRYATTKISDIDKNKELTLILNSNISGPCLIANKNNNEYYNFNHFEYDFDTLKNEYIRDLKIDAKTPIPSNYFPKNNPKNKPIDCWSSNSTIFFNNWLSLISNKKGN